MNHKFPYKWNLSDGYPAKGIEKNNCNVFGTFICGGGSTMGYKLAGYNHLGGVEIDKKIAEVYKKNHDPKYLYVEDIRLFNERNDLPDELYQLDILDGSPPCSSFSMAGNREQDWQKEKKFAEGQQQQQLDDLVFVYCDTIIKLQPKIFILENVKGIITGNAKTYSKNIVNKMINAGYNVKVFLLNAASMGVPQRRERVFFIGIKSKYEISNLELKFSEKPILLNEVINRSNTAPNLTEYQKKLWDKKRKTDKHFGDIIMREENRLSMFNNPIFHSNVVCQTITSSAGVNALYDIPRTMDHSEFVKISSFPTDYDFGKSKVQWICAMSVPPVMTAQIAHQIYLQWLSKIK